MLIASLSEVNTEKRTGLVNDVRLHTMVLNVVVADSVCRRFMSVWGVSR